MDVLAINNVNMKVNKILEASNFTVENKKDLDETDLSTLSEKYSALILRSGKIHSLSFSGKKLKAIGRAGVGVNNIPVEKCTENGVVVFNSPGANANAVKELVICSLFLASRKISEGISWLEQQAQSENIAKHVEENKKKFSGCEISGKKLGVIGLGAIGLMVANDASYLGMSVIGYDPYFSSEREKELATGVKRETDLNKILSESDYISVHVPLVDSTRGLINKEKFSLMKKGVKLLNFSRAEIVDVDDLKKAIAREIISTYITDFPTNDSFGLTNVICVPHLGASTSEAEENCAVMVSNQLNDFLKNGNIVNSVNFPKCSLQKTNGNRLTLISKNEDSFESITTVLADCGVEIIEVLSKSNSNVAYTIVDVKEPISKEVIEKINALEGVISSRVLN